MIFFFEHRDIRIDDDKNAPQLDPQARLTMDENEWMRVWALVTLCGVGDTYTFGNNHNLFMYSRPSDGKIVPFPVDMDFSFNRGTTAALVGDQNLSKVINLTPNLRCFYAHILDIINTSYNTSYMNYWLAHYRSFAPGQDYSAVGPYITSRASYAIATINGAGGNAAFAVTGTNFIVTSNNLVTLSGTAPVQTKTIKLNGVEYPVTWTSLAGWTIRIPVSASSNSLNLVGYDVHGNAMTNFTRTVTVVYTGPAVQPEGAVVFNEIMYNPVTPDASYVEIYNSSPSVSFDLSDWRVNGLGYSFPVGTILTSRQFLVLAKNTTVYANTYTNAPAAFAPFDGALQNDGEILTLLRPDANPGDEIVVDKVRYEAVLPWPTTANGTGPSLQLIDPVQDNARVANWSDGSGWRLFSTNVNLGSSLGSNLFVFLDVASVVYLDDISITPVIGPYAGSNLVQNGGFEAPLAGSWNLGTNMTNSALSAAFRHSGNFGLRLTAATAGAPTTNGSLWQYVGAVTNTVYTLSYWYLPSTNANKLTMRFNTAARPENFVKPPASLFTPGAPNLTAAPLPPFPPLWLNEVQPENLSGPADNTGQREPWLELYNAGTNAVSLAGCYLADNYTNLAQWAFPPGAMIQPGEFKIIFTDGEPALGQCNTGK